MGSLIYLICIVGAFALVYWGLTQATLPPMVKTVAIVVMGLIALAFIANMFGVGGFHLRIS